MTPAEFKAYADTVTRFFIVSAITGVFIYALAMSYRQPDTTLSVALAQGVLQLITLIVGFWFGNSHKSPPPPDTTTLTQTTTDTTK